MMIRCIYSELTQRDVDELIQAEKESRLSAISTFSIMHNKFDRDYLGTRYKGTINGDKCMIEIKDGYILFTYAGRVKCYEGTHRLTYPFLRDFVEGIMKLQ